MKLCRFLKCMSIITVLSLIYINMQMQIFALAYQGKKNEKQIIELSEENGNTTFDILRLKSVNHLGLDLFAEKPVMRFQDNANVIQLVTAELTPESVEEVIPERVGKIDALLSFLSLRTPAEARAAERQDRARPWQTRSR